jgi:hypothetical protein
MKKNLRPAVLSAVLLIALALNGAFPHSALADEPAPPPPDATEPAAAPAEPPATEQLSETPPTELPPTETSPVGGSAETTPSEVIPELPPDTQLVVLDSTGEELSLSSTEAALILATGDPMWCPDGQTPGGAGCTGGFSVFDNGIGGGLLPYLQANSAWYTGPGTIYVSFLYNSAGEGGPIVIDSADGYGLWDLTIQGGWDFGILNQYSGIPSTFNEALQILNWNYDVTLNDLLFVGTGTSASVTVNTSGNIELNNVEVDSNGGGAGAVLDNTSGSGSIEVNSSSFHDNMTIGIQALSNNNITLTDVDAYDNSGGSGAVLDNCQAAVTCSATFAGTVTVYPGDFSGNGDNGLEVSSNGYILTVDITADDNGQSGAVLDNSLADNPQSVVVGYQYGNEFNDNADNGLAVRSQGDITLFQVTADDNGHTSGYAGAGAYLDNTYGNGDTFVYNYNVYTDAYGEFNSNYADGLDVLSNGNIELWYATANDNGNTGNASPVWGMGAYLDNCNWDGVECDGTGWVEVNHSDLSGNYSRGLHVYASGDIDLTDVIANDNGTTGNGDPLYGTGAYLHNGDGSGGVTITGGEFGNYVAGGNYGDGLNVYSTGDVYLAYVFADDNGAGNTNTTYGNGALLDACLVNAGACAGSGYVYVFASEFSSNYSEGLTAFSSTNIWLNYYVSAEDNGQGLNVGVGSGAILVNNFTGATGSILLYGPITLNNNFANGLTAESNGGIYMTGVDASDNGGYGAALTTSSGTVTIDPSTFNSNTGYGVTVSATDDVVLADVEANDNGSFGASIITTSGSVSIDPGLFNVNTSFGLSVSAGDDVLLGNVEAGGNGSFGASIITSAGSVSIDPGLFNSNTSFGLSVSATDDISLTDVDAGDNVSFGASLISSNGAATVDAGNFNSNTSFGLNLSAVDDINLTDVVAGDNGSFGASLVSSNGAATVDAGNFNSNTSFGLSVSAVDDITLADVVASDNGSFGAAITTSAGSVSIDPSLFNSNLSFGLSVGAAGDIMLAEVGADDNGGFGASLTTSNGGVSLDPGSFNSNIGFGLAVSATDDIALGDVSASDNGGFGVALATTGGGVTIDPSYFDSNTGFGLSLSATGDVLLRDVSASDNGSYGASIATTAGSVSIDPSYFNSNSSFGLGVSALGGILLVDVEASYNNTYGAGVSSGGGLQIRHSNFDWNTTSFGLGASASGTSAFEDVSAVHNGGNGASISSGGNVIVDPSLFEWNSGVGLSVSSGGDVSLGLMSASHNTSLGASIASGGNAFVAEGAFDSNSATGLAIAAGGNVVLANVGANHNGGAGVSVAAGGSISVQGGSFSGNTGDGLSLSSAGNIRVYCATALGNGGYGLDASLPGVLRVKGNDFSGNTAGDVNVSGGGTLRDLERLCEGWPHWDSSGLPWNVIHVTNGDAQSLSCTGFGGTVLILPSWDHVAIPCPIAGDASLTSVAEDGLPGQLGENYTFVSGLDAQVRPAVDGIITIDFLIPPSSFDSHLIILHWDGSNWVDRGGIETQDDFFEITSREAGVYVLVKQ